MFDAESVGDDTASLDSERCRSPAAALPPLSDGDDDASARAPSPPHAAGGDGTVPTTAAAMMTGGAAGAAVPAVTARAVAAAACTCAYAACVSCAAACAASCAASPAPVSGAPCGAKRASYENGTSFVSSPPGSWHGGDESNARQSVLFLSRAHMRAHSCHRSERPGCDGVIDPRRACPLLLEPHSIIITFGVVGMFFAV